MQAANRVHSHDLAKLSQLLQYLRPQLAPLHNTYTQKWAEREGDSERAREGRRETIWTGQDSVSLDPVEML